MGGFGLKHEQGFPVITEIKHASNIWIFQKQRKMKMILDGTPLLWSSMTLTNGSGSSRSGWNTNQRSKAKLLLGTETAARPFLDCCFSTFTIFSFKQKEIKHARAIKPSSSSEADIFFGRGKTKEWRNLSNFRPLPHQKKNLWSGKCPILLLSRSCSSNSLSESVIFGPRKKKPRDIWVSPLCHYYEFPYVLAWKKQEIKAMEWATPKIILQKNF